MNRRRFVTSAMGIGLAGTCLVTRAVGDEVHPLSIWGTLVDPVEPQEENANERILPITPGQWWGVPIPASWDKVLVWASDITVDGQDDVGPPGSGTAVHFAYPNYPHIVVTATKRAVAQRYWGYPTPENLSLWAAFRGGGSGGCHIHILKAEW